MTALTLKKKPPKYKTNTPITIAIPKAQVEMIKKIPRQSLQAFLENKGTPTDWYNLGFRIRIGYDLAKEIYTEEAVVAMKEVLDCLLDIKDNYLRSNQMVFTVDDINLVELGLDYVDQMTDETTRRVQLDAFHESDKFMKSIIKQVNKPKGNNHA